jgi:hypothetical protein
MFLLTYCSGEQIQAGDRILYRNEPGRVEFVVRSDDPELENRWYVEQFGGGCMIVAQGFGSVFISEPDEDLEFLGRAG